MHVLVNGVRLFFDVEGASLAPDGARMREKPTLLLLHGGPGFDHSIYKPAFSALADIAQVVFSRPSRQRAERGRPAGELDARPVG
jgi:proline iminopeptidase